MQKSLTKIRPAWVSRVGQEMARGMEVRAGFEEQLKRFFDLLEQSVTTGDPAWMDPILLDWAKSSTETDLQEGLYQVSFLLNHIIALTIQVAREKLTKQEALDFLAAVIPIYTYGLGVILSGNWLLQNPLYYGYAAVEAYLPAKKLAIATAVTFTEAAYDDQGSLKVHNAAQSLFAAIANDLAPDDPIPS